MPHDNMDVPKLRKTAKGRMEAALEAGEKLLREMGLKNADLDVLRVFIERVVAQRYRRGTVEPMGGEGMDKILVREGTGP